MIVLYKGRRGCGKTLSLVKDGYLYKLNKFKVLRNFNADYGKKIDNDEILGLDKDSKLFNCVIMIDEVQTFFDSRRAMAKTSLLFSNFIQQIRKRNIHILCTTQYSNTIDLRLRQHVDILAYPNYLKDLNVCEIVYQDVTAIEEMFFNQNIIPKTCKVVFDAKPIFKLYNHEEMIR